MAKRTTALDSAHQIGLSTSLAGVLIVVGGSSSLDFKISEIGHVSMYISTTKGAMAKRMTALDSGHQIGLSTCMEDVLIVVGGSSSLEFKNSEIEADFDHISTTRGAMVKRTTALYSAHQISLSTYME